MAVKRYCVNCKKKVPVMLPRVNAAGRWWTCGSRCQSTFLIFSENKRLKKEVIMGWGELYNRLEILARENKAEGNLTPEEVVEEALPLYTEDVFRLAVEDKDIFPSEVVELMLEVIREELLEKYHNMIDELETKEI